MAGLRLALIASHEGSNAQAVIDACGRGELAATVAVVISNNSTSRALERARSVGIPTAHLSGVTHPAPHDLDRAILAELTAHEVQIVVLAGYLKKLGPLTLGAHSGRVVNVHPALLPKYGGQGMYGLNVHKAVLRAGETVTGVTVHVADGLYDHGRILAQRQVDVRPDDSPDTLAERVLPVEHLLLVETLGNIASGDLALPDALD